ncbi:MAG: stage III sporulation AC/AD family protein [Oscillospiraceae bacterium]|nr:stage III sporulation AC/AD family protein [Oscillospiraceae bacterium]
MTDSFVRLCAAALLGSAVILVLRRGAPELGMALSFLLATGAALFGLRLLGDIRSFFGSAADMAGLPGEWLSPVYKTVGIAILSRLCADMVRDTGQAGPAAAVEIAGVITALTAALPLMRAMLEMLRGMGR